VLAEF